MTSNDVQELPACGSAQGEQSEPNGTCSVKTVPLKNQTLQFVAVWVFALVGSAVGLQVFGAPVARADIFSDESRFLQRLNAAREASGVAPLKVAPRLVEIARSWSRVLGERSISLTECTLSHNQNLLELLGPAAKVGENVGCGDATADELHEAFMNSPRHRDNILDSNFDSVGVGVVHRGQTVFVTVEFIRTVPAAAVALISDPIALVPIFKAVPEVVPIPKSSPVAAPKPLPSPATPRKPAAKAPPKVAPKNSSKPVAKASNGVISKLKKVAAPQLRVGSRRVSLSMLQRHAEGRLVVRSVFVARSNR